MRVTVRLGEPFWRAAGQREAIVALGDGATVAQAIAALAMRYPSLAPELNSDEIKPALFVNYEEARLESPLAEGATLHIVWPVSGG